MTTTYSNDTLRHSLFRDYAADGGCSMVCAFSSANLTDTRALCLRNFSQHLLTHLSSSFSKDFLRKLLTHSLKHFSTKLLYILKLKWSREKSLSQSHSRLFPPDYSLLCCVLQREDAQRSVVLIDFQITKKKAVEKRMTAARKRK